MTNSHAPTVQPRRVETAAHPNKTPRTELALLEVAADDCPQILLRVLGLVSRDGSIPATISATRSNGGLEIAIELDRVSEVTSERIARKVAEFPAVRKVRLASRPIP